MKAPILTQLFNNKTHWLLTTGSVAALTLLGERASRPGIPDTTSVARWCSNLVFAVLLLWVLQRLRFDRWLVGIVVCAVVLYLTYTTYTDVTERNYDGPEHLFFANYLATQHRLPGPAACSICSHPPMYYVLCALVVAAARSLRLMSTECALQRLSLAMTIAFVVLGIQTLRRMTPDRVAQRLGASLLAFWPTCVILSARVHDDPFQAALGAAIVYNLVSWQLDDRTPQLAWAIVLAGLAAFTKSNALAFVALVPLVVSVRCWQSSFQRRRMGQALLSWLACAASCSLAYLARSVQLMNSPCRRALGATCDVNREHFVGNGWRNYFTFDWRLFLGQPYLINDPYDTRSDHFLNMFFKSSLIGAVPPGPEFDDRTSAWVAMAMGYLLLVLLALLLVALLYRTTWTGPAQWTLHLTALLLFGQLLALRMTVPLSMHADFRYVLVMLVPMAALYARTIEYGRHHQRPLLLGGGGLAVLFALASVLFFRPTPARAKGHQQPQFEHLVYQLVDEPLHCTPGTPTTRGGAIHFGPRQLIEFKLPQATQVRQFDIALDANDQYWLRFVGNQTNHSVLLGPTLSRRSGPVHYERVFNFTLRDVRTLLVQPVSGDGYYSTGHPRVCP